MNPASRLFGAILPPILRAANHSVAVIFCALIGLCSLPAMADQLANARQLLSAGQPNEALTVADNFLSKRPNDANMLFLKGLILTEQNQNSQAIAVFTRLTERYPSLPEPYNNLAVLYASSGQYDKARVALEAAIRTNPSYATAHENLGDLYAKLASQAYDKALQMNSGNSSAQTKLTMLQSLAGSSTTAPAAKTSARASASRPASAAPIKPASASISVAKTEQKAPPKTPSGNQTGQNEVAKTVNDWASAWSAKDVKKYLSFYGSDFRLPKGKSRKAWADERHLRIASKKRISVKAESPQISISGNTATVRFRQLYKADRLSISSKKTLVLVKSGGKWKIQQERAGN